MTKLETVGYLLMIICFGSQHFLFVLSVEVVVGFGYFIFINISCTKTLPYETSNVPYLESKN